MTISQYPNLAAVRRPLAGLVALGLAVFAAPTAVFGRSAGADALRDSLAAGRATPLAMRTADVDGDGALDAVVSLDSPDGPMLAFYRGNPDFMFPNGPEAIARRDAESGALSAFTGVSVTASPFAADMIQVGDFDADGRLDVVAARRGEDRLVLFAGQRDGGFSDPSERRLEGNVTALTSGDFGHRGATPTVVAGVAGGSGTWAEVLAGPSGAFAAEPVWVALPAEARQMALGRTGQGPAALAVTAGDRLLFIDAYASAEGTPEAVSELQLGGPAVALALRGGAASAPIAVLDGAGALSTVAVVDNQLAVVQTTQATGSDTARLVAGRLTGAPAGDLLVADSASGAIDLFPGASDDAKTLAAPVRLAEAGTIVAAGRFDADAIDDVVLASAGDATPRVVPSERRATFTVTSPADSGPGTLRQGILAANANLGADLITFGIVGSAFTINLASPLPTIADPVTIDGTSQSGFSGSPIIELRGTGAGPSADGLRITAGSSAVRGLVINGFSGNGIVLQGGAGSVISGNYIGTTVAGTAALQNGLDGVLVLGSADNTIGGVGTGARNVISGNGGDGVSISGLGSAGNIVLGNTIGATASGASALGNGDNGVLVATAASGTTVGGATAASANLISGNDASGVAIAVDAGSGNAVTGNRIGLALASNAAVANDGAGVSIGSSGNSVATNVIASNGGDGVAVTAGTNNLVSGNSIFSNGGLGIDLGPDGPTANDALDADAGPNTLQNFPVLTAIVASSASSTTIQGTLSSAPATLFTIQFFSNATCDASGFGEGEVFLGSTTVTTDAAGAASFSATVPAGVAVGRTITATATGPGNNTSEFSACLGVQANADVSITKTASAATIPTGQQLVYTVTVTNAGPLPATDVTVFDSTPSGTTFVSATQTQGTATLPPAGGTGALTFNLGTIQPAGTVTITIRVNVTAPAGVAVVNTAFVTSSTADPNTANNSASVSTNVIQAPVITSIVKKVTDDNPFRLQINGSFFQPGAQVFIGSDTTPWPDVKFKSSTRINVKGGNTLKARFPKGVPVQIRVVNPDGGTATSTFTR